MMFKNTTQVPNVLFDTLLPQLTESELKIILVIIRQTSGWVDKRTGHRKTRDRISHSQFMQKTGLSRRVISKTLKTLTHKGLITISDHRGQSLHQPEDRKGRSWMFYSFAPEPTKPKAQTFRFYAVKDIGEVLKHSATYSVLTTKDASSVALNTL